MRYTHQLTRAAFCAAALLAGGTAQAANLLENGSFDGGYFPWEPPGWWAGGDGTYEVDEQGRFCTTITALGTDDWGAQLRQTGLEFVSGETYNVSLKAWSSVPVSFQMSAADETDGFVWIFGSDISINAPLSGEPQTLQMQFTAAADSDAANFRFLLGGGNVPVGETVCFDDVVVEPPAVNLITNSTFDDGTSFPWEVGFFDDATGSSEVDADGRFCVAVDNPGANPWSTQVRENDISYVEGRTYQFSADAWSSAPVSPEISGVDEADGFTWHFGSTFSIDAPLGGPPQPISATFVNSGGDTETGKFRFLLGDTHAPAGTTVCLDNIELLDPEASGEEEDPPPPVHVNQVGYLPGYSKQATYALPEDAANPGVSRQWTLLQGETAVDGGQTLPQGADEASGDTVHLIDFSHVTTPGEEYTIEVTEGDETYTSQPFAIGNDAFDSLKYDALAYFYHSRSGTPILAEVVGEEWARPTGHPGDTSVETIGCLTGESDCYTLDSSGGWYDAGDHGKYVVNGGISVWTLLNQYERAKYLGGNVESFADGSMQLPAEETANGTPDLLDEARWEIEWFFNMQVGEARPLAGMVHHKMHGEFWTGIPTAPHNDPATRYVHPPSTAATLNFAAVGAQCYRAYQDIDPAFADECLARAELAYEAANANPVMLADTVSDGGGAYSDSNVDDEFYWAASELYLATGEQQYADDMTASDLHLSLDNVQSDQGIMGWPTTNALGLISMATVGEFAGAEESWVRTARDLLVDKADEFAAQADSQGYGIPVDAYALFWGSNSVVTNNMLVMGLANDFTCEADYVDAMNQGMAYLLGRNPLGHSYVTGYGERATEEPHHRFWANVLNSSFPPPPPGVLAGGPNSGLDDPIAQAALQGCAPEKCYMDHIEAFSLNEVTINWNSPLAWVSAYLDEAGDPAQSADAAARCELRNEHFSSFEDASRPWTIAEGSPTVERVAGGRDGDYALSVDSCGFTRLQSPVFQTSEFEIMGDELKVDINLPTEQDNPYWLGQAQAFVTSEQAGVYNAYLGHVGLTGLSLGEWETLTFDVSDTVLSALSGGDYPATLNLVVNTNNCGDPLLLDNVRFGGDLVVRLK